jgi:hypothetical protein
VVHGASLSVQAQEVSAETPCGKTIFARAFVIYNHKHGP